MYIHRSSLLLALAFIACTGRPLDGTTETGPASATADSLTGPGVTEPAGTSAVPTGTTDPSGTSAVTTGTGTTDPTGPGATDAVSTAEVTTDAQTGGSSTAGPVDPSGTSSESSSTGDTGMLPPAPRGWPAGLTGCNQVAPVGTQVSGQSALGPFAGARAYFGIFHAGWPGTPILLFLSAEADAAAELAMPDGSTGAILEGNVWSEDFSKGGWPGTWPYMGRVVDGDEVAVPPDLVVTIEALAGNWDAADPNDPPRVVGTLAGPISGPFDAVYCAKLDIFVIPE